MHILSQPTHHRKEDKMYVLPANTLHLTTMDPIRHTYTCIKYSIHACSFFLQKKLYTAHLLHIYWWNFLSDIMSSPPPRIHDGWSMKINGEEVQGLGFVTSQVIELQEGLS